MIQVESLSKKYARHVAVNNISFAVEKGDIVGFLGPNGAGKTTTMRILTCFMPPTAGRANVAGFDVFEQPFEVKKRIGYLPETPPLYPEMNVTDYLTFVARLKNVAPTEVKIPRGSGDGAVRGRRRSRQADLEIVERIPAARRSGASHYSQSRCADS